MGHYNPRAPQVLGPEWVPIRDETIQFSPAVNVVELGHTFSLDSSLTASEGRFYLHELSVGEQLGEVYFVNIYPRGAENRTGPVRRCVIPLNSVGVTGTFNDPPTLAKLSTTSALDAASAIPNQAAGSKRAETFYAVNQFQQELIGKRILEVNLLLQISWDPVNSQALEIAERFGEFTINSFIDLYTGGAGAQSISLLPGSYNQVSGATNNAITQMLLRPDLILEGFEGAARVGKLGLGEVNQFWQNPTTALNNGVLMPWRLEELLRFEATSGTNRTWFRWEFGASVRWMGDFRWSYTALEVIYCEENRVAFGGVDANTFNPGGQAVWDKFTVPVTLRTPTSLTAAPVLPVGEYLVTVCAANTGDRRGIFDYPSSRPASANPIPNINGLREYIAIPTHEGVRVNVTQTPGETFTSEPTDVLPQLSLHDASLVPSVDPHGYGRLARAHVYGAVTATQDILPSALPVDITGNYPQVRYYARRFGDLETNIPLRLALTSNAAVFCEITPDAFNELPAILDGWKEVTLRLQSTPTFHSVSGAQNWTWSSVSETKGNRWEILGAIAPAVSGTPGNPFNLVASGQRLGPTTYGGTTANADWVPQYAPVVSGTASDDTTDLVLLLSQDPPTITGLAVTGLTQALTTYTECDTGTCCTPTHLHYNRVTWSKPGQITVVDTGSREVTGGLGTNDTEQTYTLSSGSGGPDDYSVRDGELQINVTSSTRNAYVDGVNIGTVDAYVTLKSPIPIGASMFMSVQARFDVGAMNGYRFLVEFQSDLSVDCSIQRITGGAATTIAASTSSISNYTVRQPVHMRLQCIGTTLRMKVWMDLQVEPTTWLATITDATYTAGTVGLRAQKGGSATNTDTLVSFDNFVVASELFPITQPEFGYYELQRFDPVEAEWKTVMKATNIGIDTFNDYEARVGVQSTYRIRVVNALRFVGPWSSEVSRTITEPGVTLPSCGSSKRGVLTFTSNEVQNGSSNLAYAMVWEGAVVEDFTLVEASTVQLQPMFDRDYQVAFHGTERGGEAFSRTLLLANAAVADPQLANGHSLRNLAWEDLPYVCVRDDIGDRWLAVIIVPSINARRNRRLYNADLSVIEVTATPSPVDP